MLASTTKEEAQSSCLTEQQWETIAGGLFVGVFVCCISMFIAVGIVAYVFHDVPVPPFDPWAVVVAPCAIGSGALACGVTSWLYWPTTRDAQLPVTAEIAFLL